MVYDFKCSMEEDNFVKRSRKRSRSVSIESNSVESESHETGSVASNQVTDYFPASKLFEYQWPLGDEGAEHCMLQEQVMEYLDIRGMQRKYPDLTRRTLDMDERRYLVGRGVVTEIQSNLGLVALHSEEVMELMADDYPQKYREYIAVVQEREFQAALKRKTQELKRMALMADCHDPNSSSSSEIVTKSIQLTVDYNSKLAEQRRTIRKMYIDTQTNIAQIPRRPPIVRDVSPETYYPVALLPGQYSDNYRHYTPSELRRLPLDTTMEIVKSVSTPTKSDSSDAATSKTPPTSHPLRTPISASLTSVTSANQLPTTKAIMDLFSILAKASPLTENLKNSTPPTTPPTVPSATPPTAPPTTSLHTPATPTGSSISKQTLQPKLLTTGKSVLCSICFKGRGSNKEGRPEDLLQCSTCGNTVHPSCYNLSEVSLRVLKSYPWQCLDCKTCQVCNDPNNEDKMVCCDVCDKGYHSFCVGLSDIPDGRWVCSKCARCVSCGTDSPGKAGSASWQHELDNHKTLQTLCVKCSSYFRLGYYCPLCLKVYYNDETDSPMVCCDQCDKWIHIECDNISEERYKELSSDVGGKAQFTCPLCRAAGEGKGEDRNC